MQTSTSSRPRPMTWPLLAVFGALLFSYYPLLSLGTLSGMHIDISLLYVLTLVAVVISFGTIWQARHHLISSWPLRLLVLFSAYLSLTILWSPNSTRSLATAGFMWLLTGLVMAITAHFQPLRRSSRLMFAIVAVETAVMIVWAAWQIIGDTAGVSNSLTLLPEAYQSTVFGVARPTAFALEPQFFASLLLVPFCWLSYRLLIRERLGALTTLGFISITATLVLTLSRGGLLAASISLILLLCFLYTTNKERWLLVIGLLLAGIFSALSIVAISAQLNTRDSISGYSAVQKSVSQLTLGGINLPSKSHPRDTEVSANKPRSISSSGYVASSTTSRTSMAARAIEIWRRDPQTVLFGVGIGGFGAALHAADADEPAGRVVNNYYLEMLVETGIIGTLIFAGFIICLGWHLLRKQQWLITAVIAGFLVQWNFFSGNANVIHIWCIIGLACGILIFPQKPTRSDTIR